MKRLRTVLVLAALGAVVATSARAQDAERGKELFSLCQHCHGTQGEGKHLALAPSIGGQDQWYVVKQLNYFKEGVRAMHFDDLAGMRMRPMARWLKTPEDVASVALYVSTLPKAPMQTTLTGGDPTRGAALYATCSGCHGAKGEGVEAVGAPSLAHTSDWYQLTQIKNYQQGIRGTDPRDVTGAAMRGMSMLLSDEQSIKDVLAYVGTITPPATAGAK